ncbi:MAG: family 78 glycoside hydrolase catalytic domain [Thermonemataceae bacterium]
MKIINARIEEFFEQLGVDTTQPRNSWGITSTLEGKKQSKDRLIVAEEKSALDKESTLLFDSGIVHSDNTLAVPYEGQQLLAVKQYHWQVQVWDEQDQLIKSEPQSFVTGKLDDAWQANWISTSEQAIKPFLLRRSFPINKPVKQAFALVSGLGQFIFNINGKKVGNHELDPGWTNYNALVQYVTFEVTPHLVEGDNVLALEVANGWYLPDPGERYYAKEPSIMWLNKINKRFSFNGEGYRQFGFVLAGLVELHLHFEDGSSEIIRSDSSWKAAPSPTTLANIFGSEVYDANKYPIGWSQAGFDASQWQNAKVLNEEEQPQGKLVPQNQPPVIIKKTYEAQFVREIEGGLVYDLGQNMSGMFELEVMGEAGQTVKLRPAEKLDKKGMINQKVDNFFVVEFPDLDVECTYILRGDKKGETWKQSFSYFGGRYIHIKGVSRSPTYATLPYLKSLKAHYITTASPVTGHFETSDERINAVYKMVTEAIDSNLNHVHTDCPTIEKFAWLEPSHLMAPSVMHHRHVADLWRKILADIRSEQYSETDFDMGGGEKQYRGKGFIPARAPNYVMMGLDTFMGSLWDIPVWGSTILLATDWHYRFYGDIQVIAKNYESGKDYAHYLKSKLTPEGFLNHGLGDWGNPEMTALTKSNIETAVYYRDLKLLAHFASILDKPGEERQFKEEAAKVLENYNQRLLFKNKTTKRWGYRAAPEPKAFLRVMGKLSKIGKTGLAKMTQACQALPLYYGMVPEDKRDDVEKTLLDILDRKGFVCGEVALYYVLQVLNNMGENQRITDFVVKEEHPSYYRFVQQGETTLPEEWSDKARSRNHDMLGHIVGWFYRGMAGIESIENAFKKIRIRPFLPKGMQKLQCTYKSVRGNIEVKITKRETLTKLQIGIPPNCEALIDVTRLGSGSLKLVESGRSVLGGQVVLPAGSYTLQLKHEEPNQPQYTSPSKDNYSLNE